METHLRVLTIVAITILLVSIFLHICGIYVLSKISEKRTNQHVILINLSIVEIILSAFHIVYLTLSLYEYDNTYRIQQVIGALVKASYNMYYLTMILLTIDRFLASKLSFRYAIMLSNRKVLKILICLWSICITALVPLLLINYEKIRYAYSRAVYPTFDFAFLVSAFVTYGYILKIAILNKFPSNAANKTQRKTKKKKFFTMTGLIILSFTLFVIIPDLLYLFLYFVGNQRSNLLLRVLLVLWNVNFLLDPIIYIFLQKKVKAKFTKTVCFWRRETDMSVHCQDAEVIANIHRLETDFEASQI